MFHETRKILGDELGIEVSPALRELASLVLRQDRSLDAASPRDLPARETGPARNPYKGLSPFGEADARDFFGREELSRQLVDRLGADRFVAVVGPSGCGKSSLVRAGLVPLLRQGALPGSAAWPIAELSPGAHPLEELEAALLRVAVNPPASLMEQLTSDDRGLCRAVKRVLPAGASELVLVIDQFEELFALTEDEERQSQVLTLLERAVADPRSRLRLVVTLRADFYDRPLRHLAFARLLQDRVVSVSPLAPEEIERAIAAPAAGVGVSLEPGLLVEIVVDVLDQPGALPLLQYALTELFDRRDGTTLTRSAYRSHRRCGRRARRAGRRGVLEPVGARPCGREAAVPPARRGRRARGRHSPAGRSRRARRRRDGASASRGSGPRGCCRSTATRAPAAPSVEIAHDALIVEWELLREWIDAARDDIRARHRLSTRAAEWEEAARDPSFLLRGTQLSRFETWATESGLAQTEGEREFLGASIADREAVRSDDEARRARQAGLERRAMHRLRALVAVLAAAAVVALGLTLVAFDQSHRSQRQARIASARQLASASVANLDVDPELSILLAIQAVSKASVQGAPLPEAVDALHRALAASRIVLTIRTPATAALAVSPDGSRIAAGGSIGCAEARDQEAASSAAATKAAVWDARTGKRLLSLVGATSPIHDIAYSPSGTRLATGGDDGRVIIWDASTGKRLFTLADADAGGGFLGVGFSPERESACDGRRNRAACGSGAWTAEESSARSGPAHLCAGCAWSPDGKLIGAGQFGAYNYSSTSAIRVWDVRSGRLVFRTTGTPARAMLRFSPDGRDLIVPTVDGTAEIWSLADNRLVTTLTGHSGQVVAVAYSPDGKLVATGATDRTARVWDARTGKQLLVLAGHTATVDAVEFTPDGRRLVTTSEDGTVRSWDVTARGKPRLAHPRRRQRRSRERDASAPNGRRLLTSGTCDGKLKLWSAKLRSPALHHLGSARAGLWLQGSRHPLLFGASDTSPDGTIVAQGQADGTVQLLDARTGKPLRTLPGGHAGVQKVRFDPTTGARLATGNWDGTAIVWDSRSGARLQTLATQQGIVESVAFSPDGRTLATAGEDATTQLWDIATGTRLLTLTGHSFALTDVGFSPDGSRLATSSGDGTVRVYVLPVGELLAVARRRLTRGWTQAECRTYLASRNCPTDAAAPR